MKQERSNIKFPLWRKKVDASLLDAGTTPIPAFILPQWNIQELFTEYTSKNKGLVVLNYGGINYEGSVYQIKSKSRKEQFRLTFEKALSNKLKKVFSMSYMRFLEEKLRKQKGEEGNIEEEIPFWEFLDLEFDSENKTFYLKAHYKQKPQFTHLFSEIVSSHILDDINDTIDNKDEFRISKQDWKLKSDLKDELEAKNVLYNLIDVDNKEVYIGETESLQNRLGTDRTEIPGWTHYRFDSLPNDLTKKQRVAIERLMIRTFASFLKNNKNIPSFEISDFKLTNKKIDN